MNRHLDIALERLEHSVITGRLSRRAFVTTALATGLIGAAPLRALADELDTIRTTQADRVANLAESYDYIVVGSGSAGCALVGTLAAKTDGNILLIEAGDWDTAPAVDDPRVWFTNLGTERDWGDVSIPSPGVNGRAIPEHTGRVVGGGSSINATIWARPTKADMDHWAEVIGDAAWNYENSREVFKRIENWRGTPNAEFRGTDGPVWVQPALNDAEFAVKKMMDERLIIARPDYIDTGTRRIADLRRLETHNLIPYPEFPRPSYADFVLSACYDAGFETPMRVFTMDLQTAISLVAIGEGVCIVPESVSTAKRNGVKYLPIEPETARTALSIN